MRTGAVSIASDAPSGPTQPPELVRRFKAALDRLNPEGGRIGLAVSGGPDSMAMLLLAHEAIPGAFEVATVNHGLRPEAADECALVARACAERRVECAVLEIHMQDHGGNLLEQARNARYRALRKWQVSRSLDAIATAHHADDQAETLLMRANRGSGLPGLAGVREVAWLHDARVIRPLLEWRRTDLGAICLAAGVQVAQDPSNDDERFDRVRLRQLLARTEELDVAGLARTAAHLAEVEAFILGLAENSFRTAVERKGPAIIYIRSAFRLVDIEVVLRILRELKAQATRAEVARMIDRLWEGENASLGGVLASCDEDMRWHFRPEPPRRSG